VCCRQAGRSGSPELGGGSEQPGRSRRENPVPNTPRTPLSLPSTPPEEPRARESWGRGPGREIWQPTPAAPQTSAFQRRSPYSNLRPAQARVSRAPVPGLRSPPPGRTPPPAPRFPPPPGPAPTCGRGLQEQQRGQSRQQQWQRRRWRRRREPRPPHAPPQRHRRRRRTMPGPARERQEEGGGRRSGRAAGGAGARPGGGAGPAPPGPAAAGVRGAGSPGPLLGHRAPSTAVAAVAAAADSCSSPSRRLLPARPLAARARTAPPRSPGGSLRALTGPPLPGPRPPPQAPPVPPAVDLARSLDGRPGHAPFPTRSAPSQHSRFSPPAFVGSPYRTPTPIQTQTPEANTALSEHKAPIRHPELP
jgi:hypothetical protein